MKLVIFGSILVIGMVMFGNNPVEEARKKEEEKYKGIDDPLIRAITEHHEESPFSAGSGNGMDEYGRPERVMPSYMYAPNSNTGNSVYNGNIISKEQAAPVQEQPKTRPGFYPPPPLQKNRTQQRNTTQQPYYKPAAPATDNYMQQPEPPRSDGHMYLRSGQRLAYSGHYVYSVDENGQRRSLPDGNYTTKNGVEIMVRGGRKIIASN
ncbi:MAG: hypothetical protein AB7L92_03980 [Alphaproteobacteria bacterium]